MSSNNEININVRITKKHLIIALIAIVATSMIIPYQIFAQNQQSPPQTSTPTPPQESADIAAPVTGPHAEASSNMVLAKSWYLTTFKTGTFLTNRFDTFTKLSNVKCLSRKTDACCEVFPTF